ncbi:VanZ family protein [Variovorax sp. J22G21]|uniref:VanZ family protein n=1 Tax=Variovorax fucosicus TaxID=3053517 RepID=UPI0025778C2B|nr:MULTISPECIES: VanZ family protein [unclassified Variovorax]MDM0038890.1 VanZ family protein [Variovorax sp. J22R193]MDM0063666.1 VanZ family protein [Variovorax sp. J22G21]
MAAHKTTALPLALAYAALILYASLYPFADWRDQGIAPWAYLAAPWPKYWTGFDFAINIAGYVPLGFLAALTVLRTRAAASGARAVLRATLAGAAISFAMETLQSYLPARIPSNVDFGFNTAGTLLGAVLAVGLERMGAIAHWHRTRSNWFVEDARGALVLLALWPVALLFPAAVTFGLGQVFERLETAISELLLDTPFIDWMPLRQFELQPLVPGVELLCVMLGALVPCLLGFMVTRSAVRRAMLLPLTLLVGIAASALSAALSYGPPHAWSWLSLPVQIGIVAAGCVGIVLLGAPRRLCGGLLLLALVLHLSLLNQAPESAYFAQTLATWEQGRFIRFNGLAQWLGWLWPFATLGYALVALSRRTRQS